MVGAQGQAKWAKVA